MTKNSKFVLRWEIDNATAVHVAGETESDVFNECGFTWTAKAEQNENKNAKFTLRCGVDHNEFWNCKAKVRVRLVRTGGTYYDQSKKVLLNPDNDFICYDQLLPWYFLTLVCYNSNDKVTVEFHIHIIRSERFETSVPLFAEPNNRSDGILTIGDEKLHVSKEYLAVQSPYFEHLFFGESDEGGKEEAVLENVVYEEFLDLLRVLYLEMEISNRTVQHILKLADRFQIKRVVMLAQKHLVQSKNIDALQKLILANKYRLTELRDNCLNSFSSAATLRGKIKSSPEVANFSDGTKAAIFDRMMKLP